MHIIRWEKALFKGLLLQLCRKCSFPKKPKVAVKGCLYKKKYTHFNVRIWTIRRDAYIERCIHHSCSYHILFFLLKCTVLTRMQHSGSRPMGRVDDGTRVWLCRLWTWNYLLQSLSLWSLQCLLCLFAYFCRQWQFDSFILPFISLSQNVLWHHLLFHIRAHSYIHFNQTREIESHLSVFHPSCIELIFAEAIKQITVNLWIGNHTLYPGNCFFFLNIFNLWILFSLLLRRYFET